MADVDAGGEMVSDISGFKPATQHARVHFERGKLAAAENEWGAILRVVDVVTAKLQFQRVGSVVESDEVTEPGSVEDANRLLDER